MALRFKTLRRLALVSMLVLTVVEVLCRTLPLPDPRFQLLDHHKFSWEINAETDRLLGFRLKKSMTAYGVRLNAFGFVGPEFEVPKPSGTFRIFCLGGSTTLGVGADGDRYAYPALLQQMFDRTVEGPARHVEVINGGVFGYNTIHTALRVTKRLDAFQPDMYVIMDGLNDQGLAKALPLTKLVRLRKALDIPWEPRPPSYGFLAGVADSLPNLTSFVILREYILAALGYQESGYGLTDVCGKVELLGYRKNLQVAINHAKRKGIVPVLVDEPMQTPALGNDCASPPEIGNPDLAELLSLCARTIYSDNRALSEANSVALVEPLATLMGVSRMPDTPRVWADDLHLARYGNYLLAREIYRKLMGMQEIQAATRSTSPLPDTVLDGMFQEIWK
ncbi:SGNH/GDSL hydrolase family protein [Fundidesulfovibrio terrae]|uniref:SGNH/GDSL hydrolase family protein n=1 Tax=Fundidesulfovibrio terrae TaxID=2922866 RepID=UPI001FAE98A2|nr:SGNH/GDSL hydrolase family protein [Fundidesulfovibrio terrae]